LRAAIHGQCDAPASVLAERYGVTEQTIYQWRNRDIVDDRSQTPQSPRTNGIVDRIHGRIEKVHRSHHFRSGEELETTLHRYVWLYNQQLPQSALGSKMPLQAMKDWHKLKPALFRKRPYYLLGCDS
jgi:hypothetical protein